MGLLFQLGLLFWFEARFILSDRSNLHFHGEQNVDRRLEVPS